MNSSLFTEEMTTEEIKSLISSGKKNVILPIGAMEQHGPHLPINTDTLSAYTISRKIAERINSFLIAPIIPLGCSNHHLSFEGTISLSYKSLISIIEDVCNSLSRHGFEKIFIITTHGGNIPAIDEFMRNLKEPIKSKIFFIKLADFDEIIDKIARKKLGSKLENHEIHSCHACLHETSFMLKEYSEKVRISKIAPGRIKKFDYSQLLNGGDMKDISPNGILGDPTLATKELGELFEEAIIEADIREINLILKSK